MSQVVLEFSLINGNECRAKICSPSNILTTIFQLRSLQHLSEVEFEVLVSKLSLLVTNMEIYKQLFTYCLINMT